MMLPGGAVALALSIPVAAPAGAGGPARPPADPGGSASGIRLVDVAARRGLRFVHGFGRRGIHYIVETTGSGACAGDFDGDGDDDVYLVNGGVLEPTAPGAPAARSPSRLFRNDGGRFTDVTAASGVAGHGWGMGCAVADVDGDGDLDLLVTNVGPDELFLNDGRGRFTDVAAAAGLADPRWTTSAGFADFDGDGDLDLYVGAYVDFTGDGRWCAGPRGLQVVCRPKEYAGIAGRLYRNDGPGAGGVPRFVDVTRESGAVEPVGKTLGVLFEDLTGDGRPDIYLANDTERNTLLVNRGDGTFTDRTLAAGVGLSESGHAQAGMGVEAGDLDGDTLPELVVTNFQLETNSVYRGATPGTWRDESESSGMGPPSLLRLGFGVDFADLDLDGDLDVYVANGHVDDKVSLYDPSASYGQRDQVFENVSTPGHVVLRDVSAAALEEPALVGRGSALLDYDGDGDLDVVVNDSGGPPLLLENRTPRRGRHWLAVRLAGPPPNTHGVGAEVDVEAGGRRQWRRIRTASSFLSTSAEGAWFGVGTAVSARVTVRWPDGTVQDAGALGLDRLHVLRHPRLAARPTGPAAP